MPRIVTGELGYSAVVQNASDGTTEYGSSALFGSDPTVNKFKLYSLYFMPVEGELQETSENIQVLRILLTVKKKTTNDTEAELVYRLYNSKQSWTGASELYDITNGNGAYAARWVEFNNTQAEQAVVITLTGTDAKNAAQYGFSVSNGSMGDTAQIKAYSMEADVSDRYVPPAVSLMDGFGKVVNGKYWHNPNNPFTLIVNYSQEAGDPIGQILLTWDDGSGYIRTIYGGIGDNTVTVEGYIWDDLPCAGMLKLQVASESGAATEIEMPFEVAIYEVRFTSHTSGTVVKSNSDLTVGWESVWPDKNPDMGAAVTIKSYTVWKWWDDENMSSGTVQSGNSTEISADALESHRVLHMKITEKYENEEDSFVSRDTADAPELNLYIQQVAGVGSVTVGDLWFTDPDIWFPGVTVSWASTGQKAFQVKVGDVHDSGPVWGSAQSYKVPLLLNNGVYPVTVRVQDANGVWGDWTEPVWITIENTTKTDAVLSAIKKEEGVELSIAVDEPDLYSSVLFYRNGESIAQMPVTSMVTYTDRNAVGPCVYMVRFVASVSTLYRETEPVTVDATPATDGFVLPDGTWLALRYTENFPRQYPASVGEEVYARYYAGREYPVYMRSGRKDESITMTYTDKGNALADKMEELAGACVLYKTTNGKRIYGILGRVQAERGRMRCRVTFVLRRANFEDAVPYTWPEE